MYQPWHMIKGMTVCYNPTQPGVHMTSLQHPGVLLMRQWMFSWGISSQTWIEASVNSWTVCGATCRLWMEREMMSQMCSIGFRSGERAGESIASTHSSCRNCWHTCDTTWGRALPCIRRNPGPPAPAYGLTMGLRAPCTSIWSHNGSEDLIPVPNGSQGTSGEHMEGCVALQRNASPHYYWPTAKAVMLEDVAGRRTFSTASPDSVTSVTCAQCEPALICEEHRAPIANLPILVFSGKCQSPCTVLGCKHKPHLWMSAPHTIFMKSVSDSLSRNMLISGLLFWIPPACPLSTVSQTHFLESC